MCVLLFATVAWGQAAKPTSPPAPPRAATAPAATAATGAGADGVGSTVGPATAVITIPGLCDKPPVEKSKAATCKTVVTRAEFEQLVAAVAPTIAPAGQKTTGDPVRHGAGHGPQSARNGSGPGTEVSGTHESGPHWGAHQRAEPEPAGASGENSDKEIETYYHNNEASFQEVDLQRIFIPRSKQTAESKDKPADDAAAKDAAKKEQQESEDAMKKLAEALRGRAAAGEDFAKLQDEAIAASGFKGKTTHPAGQSAPHQPAARPGRGFQPEAGRDFAADHYSQRIPGVQGGRKRYFAAGPRAGGNLSARCSRSACRMRCKPFSSRRLRS